MAPVRVSKSQRTRERALAQSDRSEIEASQPGSESSDDTQITKLAAEMHREARKRREERRTVIQNSHREAVKKIENAMTIRFEEIKRRMIKRHRLRVKMLYDLIQRRSTIEEKMFATSQNIENAFVYADKALTFAFGLRLQSIGMHQKAPSTDCMTTKKISSSETKMA